MRFVAGEDLRTVVARGARSSLLGRARIVAQVGAALDAAHAAGLVHRDVKPANVLLGPSDHVYLTDFGLSKHALSVGGETRSGHWVGTLDYVAPEQIRGERRRRARRRLRARLRPLLRAHRRAAVPARRRRGPAMGAPDRAAAASERARPGLPPALDDVIARAMAKRAGDRYPSAGDLGRAALAAAGLQAAGERERVVGTGAAAPDEVPTATASGPAPSPARDAPPRGGGRRPLAALAAALAALVRRRRGAQHGERGTTRRRRRPPSRHRHRCKLETVASVGRRPNSLAVGDGSVFVTNYRNRRITLLDERTGEARQGSAIGVGGRDVATGLGAAWVAVSRRRRRSSSSTRRRASGSHGSRCRAARRASRSARTRSGSGSARWSEDVPDTLVRIDPRTRKIAWHLPDGRGRPLARRHAQRRLGGAPAQPRGLALRSRLPQLTRRVAVGETPLGAAAYGAGAIWVTSPQEDTVARIDDRTGAKVSSGVGRRPTGIAARGDQIWVTSYIDHTIRRIDPETSRPAGSAVAVAAEPLRARAHRRRDLGHRGRRGRDRPRHVPALEVARG